YLLLSGAADDRSLHSFPTRRSSDLPQRCELGRKGPQTPGHHGIVGAVGEAPDLALQSPTASLERQREPAAVAQERLGRVGRRRRDRKSTRLNSSHVAISYAVFCLQK